MLTIAMILFAMPTFAADGTAPIMTSSFSMAIASGLCGLGQGKALASAAEAIARNPSATTAIRGALILGLVFIESLALYTLVIVFMKG